MVSTDERALVKALLAGNEEAFSAVVERHHPGLLRLATAVVRNRAVAEEVVQETWLAVLESLPQFEGRSSLKTWIFRILMNRARRRAERELRYVPLGAATDLEDTEAALDPARFDRNGQWIDSPRKWDEHTPERLLLSAEALAVIDQALSELPAAQRQVLTLRDVEGCSSDEVCNVLEISESNQRVLLHRARSRLRRALEKYLDPKL
ncbi:MAG: RNA polymerase sigma factor [Acidobacteria bacterium]|nr:RNA polymerase sigma factor [Acidobacteriota bacterium]